MAVEFICSRCGKDGTRCGCPGHAVYRDPEKEREERIRQNEREVESGLRQLRALNK